MPQDKVRTRLYLDTLKKEWRSKQHLIQDIQTIYLGGGTPSLLTVEELEEILALFDIQNQEVTLEANPEDISLSKMKKIKSLGINRMSIGVQSLHENTLQVIERNHSVEKTLQAIEDTHLSGFDNISIDLMYDLPNQSFDSWKKTIDQVVKLPIQHISLYNLTFEIGSLYYKKRDLLTKDLPHPDISFEMLEYAVNTLQDSGFDRYEISAFAKDGKTSKHNTGYWTARPFLGLGPSAWSYLNGSRKRNICHLKKWQQCVEQNKSTWDFTETLDPEDSKKELFAVELRMKKGVDLKRFSPLGNSLESAISDLMEKQWLKQHEETITLTEQGKLFYDDVASCLI